MIPVFLQLLRWSLAYLFDHVVAIDRSEAESTLEEDQGEAI